MIKARYKCGYCNHIFVLAYFNSQDIPERNIGCPNCRVAGEKTILIKKIRDERGAARIEPGRPFVFGEERLKKKTSGVKFRITPIVGKDRKLIRHMTLMPGVKFEDLTAKDLIKAEEIFNTLF
ncbi:hypothetical protein KA005_44950 [bacterium]|nr:hypothetical protein [bacterium]